MEPPAVRAPVVTLEPARLMSPLVAFSASTVIAPTPMGTPELVSTALIVKLPPAPEVEAMFTSPSAVMLTLRKALTDASESPPVTSAITSSAPDRVTDEEPLTPPRPPVTPGGPPAAGA